MFKTIFVSSVLVVCAASNAQSLNENLISNGDFAQGSQGWQLEAGIEVAMPPIQNPDESSNHSYALQMQAQEAPDDGYIHSRDARQCIPIGKARKMQFSATFLYPSALPEHSHGHRTNLIWYYDSECSGNAEFGTFLEPKIKNGWQTLFINDLEPALNAKAVQIEVAQNQRSSRKDLNFIEEAYFWLKEKAGFGTNDTLATGYWDNFNLQVTQLEDANQIIASTDNTPSIPTSINLLINSDFKEDLKSWKPYHSEWNATEGHSNRGSARVTLISTETSMGTVVLDQCVHIGNQHKFTMGVYFKTDEKSNQTGNGRLRISWYEEPNCKGRSSIGSDVDPQKISGWQKLSIPSMEAARNSRSAKIYIIQSIDGKGEFSAFWDDIYLMAIE